jgi:hypothetical protein
VRIYADISSAKTAKDNDWITTGFVSFRSGFLDALKLFWLFASHPAWLEPATLWSEVIFFTDQRWHDEAMGGEAFCFDGDKPWVDLAYCVIITQKISRLWMLRKRKLRLHRRPKPREKHTAESVYSGQHVAVLKSFSQCLGLAYRLKSFRGTIR